MNKNHKKIEINIKDYGKGIANFKIKDFEEFTSILRILKKKYK